MLDSSLNRDVSVLYHAHHNWLVQVLRRKLGDRDNAADLAQDTFARILAAGQLPCLREPRAYLTTIASRLTAQHFRRLALERAYLQSLEGVPQALAPSPEEQALVLEALTAVSQVLDGLSVRVREAFLLSQLDGLTYPQIAEQLGTTVNVVQKAMLKAWRHCYEVVYGT